MKKTLRSILLLTLWMVLCLVPFTANAEGENVIELTQDNYKSYLKEWDIGKYYLPSGSYILMGDITLDAALYIGYYNQFEVENFPGVDVTLDLNGHVLQQGNEQNVPVIDVVQGSNLTILDSRPEVPHKFTADSTGLWQLDEEYGDKTVNGGIITGSTRTGLVLETRNRNAPKYTAQCTMNGGNIVGCTHGSYGGGVYVGDKAEFTMNGGSIRGCTVTDLQCGYGGGVFVVAGKFSMNGGTISDCVSATTGGGDALYVTDGSSGNGSFIMSAEATINGSLKDDNPGASEGSLGVYTVTFNSDGGSPVPLQIRPQGAAVVKPADPTLDGWDFGGWYIGEDAYDFTKPVTANLTLTAKWTQHRHCVCGGSTDIGDHTQHTTDELWTAWTAKDSLPTAAGNYYLVNDVDIAAGSPKWDVGNINLCLNGKTVTLNGIIIDIAYDGCLSLTDCGNGGKIIGGSSTAGAGSTVVRLQEYYAKFNLFGGSVCNISPGNPENSIVYISEDHQCEFNMYGGTLGDPDGAIGEDSDGMYVRFEIESTTGNTFNAYGGSVRGVISKTSNKNIYRDRGTINFGGTVFESKVYLRKDSKDVPKLGESGEIMYYYPICILTKTERVRIDDQNKGHVLSDGSVSFEYNESDGSGKLTLNNAQLPCNPGETCIVTELDLEIVLLGNNRITGRGISADKLTFSGTGKLNITNNDSALQAIECDEVIVNSGEISIFTKNAQTIYSRAKALKVNDGTLELAMTSTDPGDGGVLYWELGGSVDPDKVINITLGADRRMVTGTNSDCVNAVITETTDKNAIGAAKYVYIGEKHDHCLCGGNTDIGDHTSHSDVTWIPWTATDKLPDKAGSYYLVKDVTLPEGTADLPDGVNLCLNGKAVKGTGDGTKLTSDGVITVTDCGTTGSFGELELIGDNSKLVMYNGKIVSGTFSGEVICSGEIQNGTFNGNVESSGEITGGTFNGNVGNSGTITGGIFYGTVSGTGVIKDSAKVAVVFDTDGGSAVDTQKILRGQKAAEPASPAKVGSIFDSWTDGSAAFDFTAPIIKDTTLTAKWILCDHSASTEKPSCTEGATCTVCKERYSEQLGHSYDEPVYKWNGTSCTAERVCGRDASHKETETVTAAVTVTQNRTCTLDELSTYTATFTNKAFAVQTKGNIKTADKLDHSYGEPTYTWNGTKCTAERVCGRDASHKETETVTAAVTVTQNRTCTLDELSTYTATFTNAAFAVQTKENVKTADKRGHSFKIQQCSETQHWNKCSRCDEIDARENHTGGTATCSAKAECAVCHAKYGELDGSNHSGLEEVRRVPATAADTGTMEHWHCSACGKLFADAAGKTEISSFDTILWKIPPTIIEGMNGKWNKGREDGLMFRSDAAYTDFLEVLVDGAVISADNYTTRAGSIIVELKAGYLASLTEGEHAITVRSASGNATTSFTVEAKILSPKTGWADDWTWEIAVVVAALGILCVAVVVVVNCKRETE